MHQLGFDNMPSDAPEGTISEDELRRIDETIKWLDRCEHLRINEGPNGLLTRTFDALTKLRAAYGILAKAARATAAPTPHAEVPRNVTLSCESCSTKDRRVTHAFNPIQAERIIYTLQGMLHDKEMDERRSNDQPNELDCPKDILTYSWDGEMYLELANSMVEARGVTIHGDGQAYLAAVHETVA